MKSQELAAALSPFSLIANKNALSATYRSLELSPTHVRGCASYALLERKLSLGVETTCYVDATAFLAIVNSLPSDVELKLDFSDNVLAWSCGAARGKLACATVDQMPSIPNKRVNPGAWKPSEAFISALELGAVSCDTQALSSVGLYGIVIDNRVEGQTSIYSSDNVTISACTIEGEIPEAPELITLPPDAIALLCKVLKPEGTLEVDETSLLYRNGDTRLLVKQVAKLKNDPFEVLEAFGGDELAVELPHERVTAFIKRANALAESRRAVYVTLGASKGQLSLSFAEGTAASDEYYLVDGLDVPDLPEIKLDAGKLSRALAHVTEVVLDHIERRVIVLRGADPDFVYLIGGRE